MKPANSLISLVVFLLMELLFPFESYAQTENIDPFDLTLEQLGQVSVIAASQREEPISDAPGVVTVVTSEDIKNFGARNIADIVNRLPNSYVLSSLIHPNGATGVRGGLQTHVDNHILILINGRPMRES